MKGKIVLSLFALPFLGFGAFMAYSIGSDIWQAREMRGWQAAEATLLRAGYETHTGDDSDTYEAFAEYAYVVDGRPYRNDRVSISSGADNIGDYQRDLGRRLAAALERGETIVVYVDPDSPSDSVIDRELRLGLLGFRAIFVLLFGGIGGGLLAFVLLSRERSKAAAATGDKPWLANDEWQTATIRCGSRTGMYAAWGFALFWNLVSTPVLFAIHSEITEKQNPLALVGLLFPLVGVGLLAWAIRRSLEWRRFGPAPVSLDPFPGSIGGHVGGTIDLRLPYDPNASFMLTLTSIHSYLSGSGKNRKRNERAKWQDTRIAHAATGAQGTRLTFRFDVPGELDESDAVRDDSAWHLWRLSLTADLPGVDVNRDYDVPVYATGERSRRLPESSLRDLSAEQGRLDDAAVAGQVRLELAVGGRRMLFPIGRNLAPGLMSVLIGAIFTGAGWFLIGRAGHPFMGTIFGLVGGLVVLSGFWSFLNSLEVRQEGMTVTTVRRILGIPVRRRQMRQSDFVAFDKTSSRQSQSGGRHVMHYSIYAVCCDGNRMLVGEGFRGAGQADAAIRLLTREFGLRPEPAFPAEALTNEGPAFTFAES